MGPRQSYHIIVGIPLAAGPGPQLTLARLLTALRLLCRLKKITLKRIRFSLLLSNLMTTLDTCVEPELWCTIFAPSTSSKLTSGPARRLEHSRNLHLALNGFQYQLLLRNLLAERLILQRLTNL